MITVFFSNNQVVCFIQNIAIASIFGCTIVYFHNSFKWTYYVRIDVEALPIISDGMVYISLVFIFL